MSIFFGGKPLTGGFQKWGTPKWLVYDGKSQTKMNDLFGGGLISGNLHISCYFSRHIFGATPRKGIWGTPSGPLGHPEVATVGLDDLQQRCQQAGAATEMANDGINSSELWEMMVNCGK